MEEVNTVVSMPGSDHLSIVHVAAGCTDEHAFEGVVVLATGHAGGFESSAYFYAFGGTDAEHGFGEIGFEFIKNGIAQAGGDTLSDDFDDAAGGIALLA